MIGTKRVYLRKIDNQCIRKQISYKKDMLSDFFDGLSNHDKILCEGKTSGQQFEVTLLTATDPRFDNSMQTSVLASEGELEIGDLMAMYKIKNSDSSNGTYKNKYIVELIKSSDNRYEPYLELFEDEIHTLTSLELDFNVYGIHIKEKNDALSEENPHICIGWSCLGDLSNIETKEELSDLYEQHIHKSNRGKGQDVGQIWRFKNDAQPGDYVIFADNDIFHIGVIESDYYYDNSEYAEQDKDYTNLRKVTWLKKNIEKSILSDAFRNSLGAGMSFWTLNDYKSAVAQLLDDSYIKDEIETDVNLQEIIEQKYDSNESRNRIFFGAPGTGKSFTLKKETARLLENGGAYERVTFHPDYSYANFVGTYKPTPKDEDDDKITYKFVPGPFMRVLTKALNNLKSNETTKPHILIIEEINRANVAAVFGDVFQLLDRTDNGVSEYSINTSEDIRKYLSAELSISEDACSEIKIPSNMFIWATMNSADQGVFPMDTAFKRRWNFKYIGIDDEELDENNNEAQTGVFSVGGEDIEWNILRRAINKKLSDDSIKLNEDKLMGPYFIKVSDNENNPIGNDEFIELFCNKVLMYLFEDAVKTKRTYLFDSKVVTVNRYSNICKAFRENGLKIFGENFKAEYDNQKKELDDKKKQNSESSANESDENSTGNM